MAKSALADELTRVAQTPGRLELCGAPEGFDALALADIAKTRGGLTVFVARDSARASAFQQALAFFAPKLETLRLPGWDCLPYDRIGPSAGVAAERMACLSALARAREGSAPRVLITAAPALIQRVPPRAALERATYIARVGQDVDLAELERYFAVNGYVRASTVSERGEFAIRGGVIDVFAPGAEEPVRLDLFGDTLESIRAFDPETQRTTRQLTQADLLPVSEVLLDPAAISRFRTGYVQAFGAPGDDQLYAGVSEGQRRAGAEHWLPLFYDGLETLFDYLGPEVLIALDHLTAEAMNERLALIKDAHEARVEAASVHGASGYRALPPDALYLESKEVLTRLAGHPHRWLTPFQTDGPGVVDLGARHGRNFTPERAQDSVHLFEQVTAHAKAQAAAGKRVLFASWTEGSSERLGMMLADHGLEALRYAPYWDAARAADPKIPQRVILPLETGFETDALAVISETDILGDRLARPRRKRRAANFLAEATALAPGDLVVHIDHGIGRYAGLTTLEVQGSPHDCLELHYAQDAKLYLPVENIDLLTRYGAESDGVQLDRLGGAAWQARRARAKARLQEMAEGLIRIAAARETKVAPELDPPHGVFDEFCARFPYEETDDQLSAVADVLADLGAGRPMDRLICGDVGFGKTEVALRAAFVAAMSGKQVAVVCPTTLLVTPALQDLHRAVPRLAAEGAPALAHGLRLGRRRHPPGPGARRDRHRHRHPRHPGRPGEVQGPGPRHRGRGAALRRRPQGEAQAVPRRGARAHPHGHAHPAHASDGAVGHPRDVDHRHPAGRPAGGAHLHLALRSRRAARGVAAREVPGRPGLFRHAAGQGPGRPGEDHPRARAGGAPRRRPRPDAAVPARKGDDAPSTTASSTCCCPPRSWNRGWTCPPPTP